MVSSSSSSSSICGLLENHKRFNEKLYGSHIPETAKEIILRDLFISLGREVSELSSVIHSQALPTSKSISSSMSSREDTILYESVDVIRYTLAILALENISEDKLVEALMQKEIYLDKKYLTKPTSKEEAILVVDIDDVLNDFREEFHNFILEEYGFELRHTDAYYSTASLKLFGIQPDSAYKNFIDSGGLQKLKPNQKMIEDLNKIELPKVILTSRPETNLRCVYDTYSWLDESGLSYHSLNFSPEKYLWVSQQNYRGLVIAIDDSPKHCTEYSKHGILVFCPRKNYNESLSSLNSDKIIFYNSSRSNESELDGEDFLSLFTAEAIEGTIAPQEKQYIKQPHYS